MPKSLLVVKSGRNIEVCDLEEVLTYFQPTEVFASPFNVLYLDTLTGSFIWSAPQLAGRYVLGLCVSETRNGTLISEYTRKMIIAVDEPVANEEVLSANQISISPNPVSEQLTIRVPEDWQDVEISVFDAMGKKVNADFFGEQVDVTGWDSGLYWVQLRYEGRLFFQKILVVD